MKKLLIPALVLCITPLASAQFGGIKKQIQKIDSPSSIKEGTSSLSEEEVGKGLKEALEKGVEKGVEQVAKPDGYFKDPEIKIPLPNEAQTIESKLRAAGQDKLVDDAIESMNRAAEDAASEAKPIFMAAIKGMTIEDAMKILKGEDNAATKYLDKSTRDELTAKFEPIIRASLDKVGATKHWNTMISAYNKLPFVSKMNPDLEKYVTEKAIDGLFVQIAKEEKEIREDPAARTSDLLKKVFE